MVTNVSNPDSIHQSSEMESVCVFGSAHIIKAAFYLTLIEAGQATRFEATRRISVNESCRRAEFRTFTQQRREGERERDYERARQGCSM